MRSARSYADESARLRADGVTYGQIIFTWSRQRGIRPLTAARLAYGFMQQQVADRWNELWPDPQRPKSHKQISYWETGKRAVSIGHGDTVLRDQLIEDLDRLLPA
jgi:hypothetical protein